MNPRRTPADLVAVLGGLREDFFKRHRKDAKRANDAWDALVSKRAVLETDSQAGIRIPRRRWPAAYREHANLFLVPELPHRFRAVYTVYRDPRQGVVVRVEWIGDHSEYDRLFGYSTP